METDLDVNQFLSTIYRYIQIGVHIKAFYSKEYGRFHRELDEVTEFYVNENNEPIAHTIYRKQMGKEEMIRPSDNLIEYIENQNIDIEPIISSLPRQMSVIDNTMTVEKVMEEKQQAIQQATQASQQTAQVSQQNFAIKQPVQNQQRIVQQVPQNIVAKQPIQQPMQQTVQQSVQQPVQQPHLQQPTQQQVVSNKPNA